MYSELNAKIYAKASRIKKEECLDLPPLTTKYVDVELSAEQTRMYKEMKNEFITFVKGLENDPRPRAVVAQLAITKSLRLQQIITGFAKTEDGRDVILEKTPRMEALKELVESLVPQGKLIIWACFKENYKQIKSVLDGMGLKYSQIHGEIKDKDREQGIKDFRFGDVPVMIANQGAGGIGINLVEAPNSIVFSRNFSLEHDMQSRDRNYRGGAEIHERITRILIRAPGTIDELIAEALDKKLSIADKILEIAKKL
jgi:SNF2 family DNA or RNA helicase